jgi:ankyrin repeat protein
MEIKEEDATKLNIIQQIEIENSEIFNEIENRNIGVIKKIMKEIGIDIYYLTDKDGYTMFIKSVYLNLTDMFLYMLVNLKEHLKSPKEIENFINIKGPNGFTALHYASYRGNIKIIEKLINLGANINSKNDNGLNIIHMASQGNQPITLIYLKEQLNVDLFTPDFSLSTPLHWACYSGSVAALEYLISLEENINIDIKDKDGSTPLHLAVLASN